MNDIVENTVEATASDNEEVVENNEEVTNNEEQVIEEKETKTTPRMFKVKVDGEEREVNEEELVKNYQLAGASHKRMQEAAAIRKQAEQFIQMLKEDPRKVLSHPNLGINLRELSEEYLADILAEEMMDPKDRELHQLKKQKEELEAREQRAAQEKEAQIQAAQVQHWRNEYQKNILEALEGSDLPKNSETVRLMAKYMHAGMARGMDLKAKDVIPLVKEDYQTTIKSLVKELGAEQVATLLGDETLTKLRKWEVDKVRNNPQNKTQTPENQPTKKRSGRGKARTKDLDNFFKELRNK